MNGAVRRLTDEKTAVVPCTVPSSQDVQPALKGEGCDGTL